MERFKFNLILTISRKLNYRVASEAGVSERCKNPSRKGGAQKGIPIGSHSEKLLFAHRLAAAALITLISARARSVSGERSIPFLRYSRLIVPPFETTGTGTRSIVAKQSENVTHATHLRRKDNVSMAMFGIVINAANLGRARG
jgi:hypothetical protein